MKSKKDTLAAKERREKEKREQEEREKEKEKTGTTKRRKSTKSAAGDLGSFAKSLFEEK